MPPIINEIYNLLNIVKGIILYLGIVVLGIVILIRGISTLVRTRDWESVMDSIQILMNFFIIALLAFSVLSSYDWIRATPAGAGLPALNQPAPAR